MRIEIRYNNIAYESYSMVYGRHIARYLYEKILRSVKYLTKCRWKIAFSIIQDVTKIWMGWDLCLDRPFFTKLGVNLI